MARRTGRGPGRLTAADTALLESQLLEAALIVFARDGFSEATIEAIAEEAGASRKTVYARFADKTELLVAAMERVLEEKSQAYTAAPRTLDPEAEASTILRRIARELLRTSLDPDDVALNRLMLASSHIDPALGRIAVDLQARGRIRLAGTLEHLKADGRLPRLADPLMAAAQFIEMVSGVPKRHAVVGMPMPKREQDAMIDAAIELFLKGYGPR